jgi:hypothetical protein
MGSMAVVLAVVIVGGFGSSPSVIACSLFLQLSLKISWTYCITGADVLIGGGGSFSLWFPVLTGDWGEFLRGFLWVVFGCLGVRLRGVGGERETLFCGGTCVGDQVGICTLFRFHSIQVRRWSQQRPKLNGW